jgi:hypothetical protein
MRAAIIAASLLATPVLAQGGKVWTAAPVPGNTRSQGAPADRAGTPSSSDGSSPFSALPSGSISDGGRTSPSTAGTTPAPDAKTPSLSK